MQFCGAENSFESRQFAKVGDDFTIEEPGHRPAGFTERAFVDVVFEG